jgi:hypothetical protein
VATPRTPETTGPYRVHHCVDGDLATLHRFRLAVDQVRGGRTGLQAQLEHRERRDTVGDRAAPGHSLGVAERHQREADERRAGHVELARNGEL